MAWLHGCYRDEKDPPVIDTDEFKNDLIKFATYCATNPTIGIITAADKVLGKCGGRRVTSAGALRPLESTYLPSPPRRSGCQCLEIWRSPGPASRASGLL
jgi:hypothetical protein